MGRPSVAAERRRQILMATIDCIGTHGVAGTTLDRIAEEAGMARGHVRHFAGNRDEILVAAAREFYFGDEDDADAGAAASVPSVLPAEVRSLADAVDYLFGAFAAPGVENAVALALVDAARGLPEIREIVVAAYAGARSRLATLLAAEYPDAASADCRRVAYSVLAIALGYVFMSDVGIPGDPDQSPREDAERLIASLG